MKSKYIKPFNLLLGIFIGVIVVNNYGLNLFQNWQFKYNAVAVEYLKVLLGLPAVILFVLLIFFSKFHSAIDYFIRNMKVKYKDVEASSQQEASRLSDGTHTTEEKQAEVIELSRQDAQEIAESIQNLQSDNTNKQQTIETLRELVVQLANRSEIFEFKYLNSILVLNSKIVLRDLFNIGQMSRDVFVRNIFVPSNVTDKYSEQLAIHNVLLVNGLIEENGSLIQVSEKGIRYLKFIGLIQS